MVDALISSETEKRPLPLEAWGKVFDKAIKDDRLVKSFQDMKGIKAGEKDGFFYTISSGNGDGKILCVRVDAHGPDDKPSVKTYGGPASSWEELTERNPEIVKDKDSSLLRIDTSQETAHNIFMGRLDPVKAAMTRKARVKGDMAFVMRNPKNIKDFFSSVGQHYQSTY